MFAAAAKNAYGPSVRLDSQALRRVCAAFALATCLLASDAPAQIATSTNETLANTATAGDQYNYWWSVRTVAVQPDGGHIAVWIDANGLDGSGYGIFGQRFNAAGAKVGSAFQVNTTTSGEQNSPSIAVAPDGSFIVAWDDGQDVFGQRFAQDASRIGSETRLNTSVTGNQKYGEVAYYPDGNLLVGYVDGNQTVLQRYDRDLRALGSEVRVSGAGVDAVIDSLAIRPDNSTVLAWTSGGDVFAQIFDPALQSISLVARLNQYTSGTQQYAVVGVDSVGNLVFTWDSDGQDGSGSGAYCRMFDASLAPRGNEFTVTSSTAGDQTEPQVAVAPSGRFVVAWSDLNNRDGGGTAGTITGYSVWMRLFNADGSPQGAETRVNQSTTGGQGFPIIDMNGAGLFVISWQGNGTQAGQVDSQGVFVRSHQLTTSGTTAISSTPSAVTAGDLVTVTMTLTAPATTTNVRPNPLAVYGTTGVFATLVSGPTPSSATVGTTPVSFTWTYRVTADLPGGQLHFGGNAQSSGGSIFPYADSAAAKITVNAISVNDIFASTTGETLVNTATAGDQYNYQWSVRTVAVQPDGSHIVVWIDANGLDGSGSGIFGQRFSASGARIGSAFQVNTITSGNQDSPSVAVAPDGGFLVAWDGPGTSTDVYAQRFAPDGSKIGVEFLLNSSTSGGQQYPDVAFYSDGTFVAGFVDGGQTVLQRFDSQSRFLGLETRISGTSNVVMDCMTVRPDNSLVVAWTSGGDVYARIFSPTLQPVTPALMINQYTAGTQQYAVVDADGEGNLLFAWESDGQDGSGKGAYARRFDSALNALTNEFLVTNNTAGDQLEPQVAVDPSGWYVVTWTDTNNRDGGGSAGSTTGWSAWMRVFDSAGYAVGPEMMVNQSITGGQGYPIIGMNDSGRFAISWQGNGTQTGKVDSQGVFYRTYQFVTTGTTTVSVSPTMVSAGDLVTVTMTLAAPQTNPYVEPNPLGVFGSNGIFATLVSGPTPSSATVGSSPVSFTWTYRVAADSYSGELYFGGNATSDAGTIFPYADSSSVKVQVTPAFYVSDLTAPNLVGDSNVASQPEQGPRAFTIGAKVTNPSLNTLTDVKLNVGDGATPGVFPATTMTLGLTGNTYQGTFALSPLAGAADCSRDLVTLGAAQPVINGGIDFNRDGVVNNFDDGVLSNGKTVVNGRVDVNLSNSVNASDDLPRPPGTFYGYREPAIIDGSIDINGDGVINASDDGTYGGETRNIYWQVAYQTLDAYGKPTWGDASDIGDDLRYYWNVWGSANDGGINRTADYSELAKVRNQIGASANKISPTSVGYITGGPPRILAGKVDINYDGSITAVDDGPYFSKVVIDGLVDLNSSGTITTADDGFVTTFPVIDGFIDYNRDGTINSSDNGIAVQIGQILTVTVHNADFGTIGQGFDENRDGLWDSDFWHQPIGEVDWPAASFRLVDIQSDVTGAGGSNPLNGITNHYDNEPYLSRLIDDRLNESGSFYGTYTYTFQVMDAGSSFVSMYQEAASGTNNEKYNGDYGTGVHVSTGGSAVSITKSGTPDPVQVGGAVTWTVGYQNTSTTNAGEPGSGNGVVIEDFIPANTTFVANSALSPTYPVTVTYSTDNGATWTYAQPPAASVTRVRWYIEVPVPPGASGLVSFQTSVNSATPNFSQITNTAEIKIGNGPVLGTATAQVWAGGSSPGSITGTVKADINNDNLGDTALAGVTVRIYTDPNGDSDPSDGVLYTQNPADADGTVTTAADGSYSFPNLPPGNYVIVQTDLSGYYSVADLDSASDSVGSPVDASNTSGTDNRISVTLMTEETDAGNDFVDEQSSTITGSVLADTDNNNTGDAPLSGVALQLRDATTNALISSTTTSGTGAYNFSDVPPGSYKIVETQPSGYISVSDKDGGSLDIIGDVTAVVVTAGATNSGNTFIEEQPVTIGDLVFNDANANGQQDSGENGLASVLVSAYRPGFGPDGIAGNADDATAVATQTTNGSGAYSFGGLSPGPYQVGFGARSGYNRTLADQGADATDSDANAGTGLTATFVLAAGTTNNTLDAGYYQPGTITGSVLADTDNNNTGDAPLSGVALELRDATTNALIASTTTSGTGAYTFSNVPPGSYKVVETQPPGYNSVSDKDGGNLDIIGDVTQVTVTAGATNSGNNFVEEQPGTITGSVLADTDNNGSGDAPIIIAVALELRDATTNALIASTTTSGTGSYTFSNISPGSYKVSETQPYGYNSVSDKDGGDLDIIGDVTAVLVTAGTTNSGNNFVEALDTCPDDWAAWKFLHPGETAGGNPDADSYDNFAEFAFAMPYDSGTPSTWLPSGTAWIIRPSTAFPGSGLLEGVFIRPKGATTNVTYTLQYAATLGNPTTWLTKVIDLSNSTFVDNGDCTETVTIHDLAGLTGFTGGNGVVRIQADLDESGANSGNIDHTSRTEVEGWTQTSLGLSCQTYNNPYQTETVFTGTVSSLSGQNLVFSGETISNLLIPGVSYYLEVTTGDLKGHRFDVVSAGGNSVSLVNDSALYAAEAPFNTQVGPPSATIVEDTVAIHRHRTINEMFPPNGFVSSADRTLADQIRLLFNGNWTIYWLYNGVANGTAPHWVKSGDSSYLDQGVTVISPGQGLYFDNHTQATSVLAYGEIRANNFIRPLAQGTSLVGGGYPLDQSATGTGSRQMLPVSGYFGSRDLATADSFYVWKGDSATGAIGYNSYFLNVSPSNSGKWVKVGDASLLSRSSEILLLGDRSVLIRAKNALNTYTIPTPWTP